MTLSKARVSGCFGCIAICFAFSGCSSDVTSPASDNNEENGGSSRDGAKATVGELSVEDACRSLLECLDPVPNSRLRARLASCEVIYADGNPSIVNISGEILISVDRKRWTFQARLAPRASAQEIAQIGKMGNMDVSSCVQKPQENKGISILV